jgi:hypothetical protein
MTFPIATITLPIRSVVGPAKLCPVPVKAGVLLPRCMVAFVGMANGEAPELIPLVHLAIFVWEIDANKNSHSQIGQSIDVRRYLLSH